MNPKIFISYSWTSQQHKEMVREWADRLIAEDGVDVILDIYDLKEGQDVNAFMEKMVNDNNITHVLVVCDKGYAEKADARKKGVGTESQIISQEVYSSVSQSKFIPIASEIADDGKPYMPTFLKSRMWIDFSSPEATNANWERLVRLLYGKPIDVKPKLGNTPAFLAESDVSVSPARFKYQALKQAFLAGKQGIPMYRQEFLAACTEYVDKLRVRQRPETEEFGRKVLEDCGKLVSIRNHIADWILLEAYTPSESFSEALVDFLEKLRELKSRPEEVTQWSDMWFEAHELFALETFLYVVAALLKANALDDLHNIFTTKYMKPATECYGAVRFENFDAFRTESGSLQKILAPQDRTLLSPAAALIQRQADRGDLPFTDLIQTELLIILMALITPEAEWRPQLLNYHRHGHTFKFFLRATQHRHFAKLARITGIASSDSLRERVREGLKRHRHSPFSDIDGDVLWHAMNMDKLDTEP